MRHSRHSGSTTGALIMALAAWSLFIVPLLAQTTELAAEGYMALAVGVPAVLAVASICVASLRARRRLGAMMRVEADMQRALAPRDDTARPALSPRPTPLRTLSMSGRAVGLTSLALSTLGLLAAFGQWWSALALGVLWAALIEPSLRAPIERWLIREDRAPRFV